MNFATVRLYIKLIYFKVLEAQTRMRENERGLGNINKWQSKTQSKIARVECAE